MLHKYRKRNLQAYYPVQRPCSPYYLPQSSEGIHNAYLKLLSTLDNVKAFHFSVKSFRRQYTFYTRCEDMVKVKVKQSVFDSRGKLNLRYLVSRRQISPSYVVLPSGLEYNFMKFSSKSKYLTTFSTEKPLSFSIVN